MSEKPVHYTVMTLFPEMIEAGLHTSILGKAEENGILKIDTVNIRDYTENKHKRVDDYPYGGGAGMVMQAEPIWHTYEALFGERLKEGKKPRLIYLSPQGHVFDQKLADELSKEEELVFLCGHYEGVDERVLEMIVTDTVSIGDYVLTGGELPAMVMIDAIARLIPGVLGNEASWAEDESFRGDLLEYPQYSRPEEFMGMRVPEVLLSGHHAKIEAWRREQSIKRTAKMRPDLLEKADLTQKERELAKKYLQSEDPYDKV
ncbi:MAG: tRNA (guanosine(37)-N1)-methyltransferase TrmD [Lachnospiraceae bacterium]|nr:tRNA (guanosine(37)-N1)-methyltransferase TrmD [Lachnospiraceae bacterium]